MFFPISLNYSFKAEPEILYFVVINTNVRVIALTISFCPTLANYIEMLENADPCKKIEFNLTIIDQKDLWEAFKIINTIKLANKMGFHAKLYMYFNQSVKTAELYLLAISRIFE